MRTPGESWFRLFRSLEGGADLHLGGELPTVDSAPRALPLYLPGLLPRRPHPYIDEVLLKSILRRRFSTQSKGLPLALSRFQRTSTGSHSCLSGRLII